MWIIIKILIVCIAVTLLSINFNLISSLKVLFRYSHILDIILIIVLSGIIVAIGEGMVYPIKHYFFKDIELGNISYHILVLFISITIAVPLVYKLSVILTET